MRRFVRFWSFTDLKVAAFTNLTESGDAVQIVGGNCLVLLFKEVKGREGEACMMAVAILMHYCHLVPRTSATRGEKKQDSLSVWQS